MEIKVKTEYHQEPLYTEAIVPDDIMLEIMEEMKEIEKNQDREVNYSHLLASSIEKTLKVKKSHTSIHNFVSKIANHHMSKVNGHDCSSLEWDKEGEIWINYQSKYDFIPSHRHPSDLSFVIWVKIPYTMEDELNYPNVLRSNDPHNAHLVFSFLSIYGSIIEKKIMTDKSFEGHMIVFDSRLTHQVYPFFTSDQYRISIAGNLYKI